MPPEEFEARRAGFRTLSKEHWEALQAEYVAYRDDLLRHIAASSSSAAPAVHHPPASTSTLPQGDEHLAHVQTEAPLLSYPPGCVIFARHVPQDTNKTALRALFASLLVDGSSALDYVDYTKGLDSVRLSFSHVHSVFSDMGICNKVLSPPNHSRTRALAPEAIQRTRGRGRGGERNDTRVARGTERRGVLAECAREGARARVTACTIARDATWRRGSTRGR
jgi:hypothetical protein